MNLKPFQFVSQDLIDLAEDTELFFPNDPKEFVPFHVIYANGLFVALTPTSYVTFRCAAKSSSKHHEPAVDIGVRQFSHEDLGTTLSYDEFLVGNRCTPDGVCSNVFSRMVEECNTIDDFDALVIHLKLQNI